MCEHTYRPSVLAAVWFSVRRQYEVAGRRPLHSAVIYNCAVDVVKLLVESWADGLACTENEVGMTPLHMAVTLQRSEHITLFAQLHAAAFRIPTRCASRAFTLHRWAAGCCGGRGVCSFGEQALPLHLCLNAACYKEETGNALAQGLRTPTAITLQVLAAWRSAAQVPPCLGPVPSRRKFTTLIA